MKKKIFRFFLIFCGLVFLIYFLLPSSRNVPDLPNSLKSTRTEDTFNIPGLRVYYTDLDRQEVINFYKKNYSNSSFLNIPLITYIVNHQVEYSRETLQSTIQSSFYEEIVHPLRESLYVNGYEWQNDPFYKPEQREQFKLIMNGKVYKSKISIISRETNPLARMVVYFGIVLFLIWIWLETRNIYKDFFFKKKND